MKALPQEEGAAVRLQTTVSEHPQEHADQTAAFEGAPAELPARVGSYVLEGEIARGGMGRIIRIRDHDFDRPLAMKILLQRRPDLEERLLREARITGVLQHPGVPPVHALGRLDDGRPYFIMKLIQGRSLKELLERASPTELPRFLAIFEQICHTIGYAHGNGVIHRDLKPGNVMVGAFGEVQVMDWGLAKLTSSPEAAPEWKSDSIAPVRRAAGTAEWTQAGTTLGTPAYMAPEQARGEIEKLDARTDVFGLGAILCNILTGKPPFIGSGSRAIINQAAGGDLADAYARLADCGADPQLVELARRCLAPEQEQRPADGSAVAEAITAFQAELAARARRAEIERAAAEAKARAERRRRRTVVAFVTSVAVLLLIGGAVGAWSYCVMKAHALVDRLLDANISDVSAIVSEMAPFRYWVNPLLRDAYAEAESTKNARKKLHASLALLPEDDVQIAYLYDRLVNAETPEVHVLIDALRRHNQRLLEKLWGVAEQPGKDKEQRRLAAACALASYDAENPRWGDIRKQLADDLVNVPAVYLGTWLASLRPVRDKLTPPLAVIFKDAKRRDSERSLATGILADFAGGSPDLLAGLLLDADDKQFGVLFTKLKEHGAAGSTFLVAELDKPAPAAADQADQADTAGEILKKAGAIRVDDDKVKVVVAGRTLELPAKVFAVPLAAGKKYDIRMTSSDVDAFLVLQDPKGTQLGFDDDGGGRTNALLLFTPPKADTYRVFAAALPPDKGGAAMKAAGSFILTVSDAGLQEAAAKRGQEEDAREDLAKRQANAAVALLKMAQPEKAWPVLKHNGSDPRARSYLSQRLSTLGADPALLVRHLDQETDVTVRRALLLALGDFSVEQFALVQRQALMPRYLEMYRADPDAGIHGALAWGLGQWGQKQKLSEIDKELANRKLRLKHPKSPTWYVNGQGQTMVVIPGPVEFWMGSPRAEAGRAEGAQGKVEMKHWRRIPRSYALAAREVTVADFLLFRKNHAYNKQYAPNQDCPVNLVSWYDAAAYCNWLSDRENIDKDQWCYRTNRKDQYAEGMTMANDYLQLKGYRLPTEAEWEYACRANAVTARHYGETEELLKYYAWYTKNSQDRRTLPVGSLKPNDFGLSDMLGNALEWCQDPMFYYNPGTPQRPVLDLEVKGTVREQISRVLRGGLFNNQALDVRSSPRYWDRPSNLGLAGFRVARTFTAD
jgi:formylglycine-generating enzyme required for sulfatase activity/serine/threonine protein kinase